MTDWKKLIPEAPSDWALIPLNGQKEPIDPATGELLNAWQQQPGYDPEELNALNGYVKAAGLLLGPPSGGVLAVDFDGLAASGKFQEVFNRKPGDLPHTVGVTSGKPSRGQRFFVVDREWWPALRNIQTWKHDGETCLELRWDKHQSVVAGAHPETGAYSWLPNSSPAQCEVAQAPAWLLKPLLRQEPQVDSIKVTEADAQRALAMLPFIDPATHAGYDDWIKVGMALHHTDPGLLAAWVDWSRPMPTFDEAECLAKWGTFANYNGAPRTIRSLHEWAKQGGYKEPSRQGDSPAIPEAINDKGAPFRALGWDEARTAIHYQHRLTSQISSIKPSGGAGQLLQMASIDWWGAANPGKTKGTVDWLAATSSVIEEANRVGVFRPENVRGRGLWAEPDGRFVWHLGDRIEVDGQTTNLVDHRSIYHYPRLPSLPVDPKVEPLSDDQGKDILDAISAMGWTGPFDALHIAGWAVTANVGGALKKRPVLQITSRFGSGKTYTIDSVVAPLLAGLAISTSNSSEAGVRQALGHDTLPVLIDESEAEDSRQHKGHLKLARLAFDGKDTKRGTPGGQELTFVMRSSVALVGINAASDNSAEVSRIVSVGRRQLPQNEWAEVDRLIREAITTTTGARLLRRCVTHLPTLVANTITFQRVVEFLSESARSGDTYAPLLAGAYLLLSTEVIDDRQAKAWLVQMGWNISAAIGEDGVDDALNAEAEARQCLDHLLRHEETWRCDDIGSGRITIRELVDLVKDHLTADPKRDEARKLLLRRGVRCDDAGVAITNKPKPLEPVFGKTKWKDGGHKARLRELAGSYAIDAVRFLGGERHRATRLPWDSLG